MKMNTTCAVIALTLGLAAASNAALTYTYSYSSAPGFSGDSRWYVDDIAGTARDDVNTPFAIGDLNDGIIFDGNPVAVGTSMVAWDPTPKPTMITLDLGGLFDLATVDITGYARTDFALGYANDVTISTSADNITYGGATLHTLATDGNQANLTVVTRTDTGVRYIQLAFDGDSTADTGTMDKWGLTEIAVQEVPEPSSAALLGLGGLALLMRRRK